MVDCIFCDIVNKESLCYKVYEDEWVMAFFDISIANDFHTLVIPKIHSRNIFDIKPKILQKVTIVTQKIVKKYKEVLGIDDVNIIQSNEETAA